MNYRNPLHYYLGTIGDNCFLSRPLGYHEGSFGTIWDNWGLYWGIIWDHWGTIWGIDGRKIKRKLAKSMEKMEISWTLRTCWEWETCISTRTKGISCLKIWSNIHILMKTFWNYLVAFIHHTRINVNVIELRKSSFQMGNALRNFIFNLIDTFHLSDSLLLQLFNKK